MECSKCGEAHTAGFTVAVEPSVCVFCYYGIAESSSKLRVRTRAQDRAEAEAAGEMRDHFDASGHRRSMTGLFEGSKLKMVCDECGLMIEREAV